MDEFVEESLETVEFLSYRKENSHFTVKDAACGTSSLPDYTDNFTQTNPKQHISVQATESIPTKWAECNDKQLAIWLKQIYPVIEAELLEGLTPIHHDENLNNSEISMIPYQELTVEKLARNTNTVSVAAWLSTRLSNIPSLVLSSSFVHDGWCEHLDQTLSLYVPRRVKTENFIGFTEKQTILVKACIRFLKTNIFDKDTFVGITESCDLIVWECVHSNNNEEVKEIASAVISGDSVVAVDWLEVNKTLTIHSDGTVCLWNTSKTVFIESRYKIGTAADITAAIALNSQQLLAGSNKGRLLCCYISSSTSTLKHTDESQISCMELRKHASSVAFLFCGKLKDIQTVVTVDISGELFLHDVRNLEDGPLLVFKIPLPFKKSVMTPKDVAHIFTRGYEGDLEIYRLFDGRKCFRTSSATGMEHFMQLSDNGSWLLTGGQNGTFQIYNIINE